MLGKSVLSGKRETIKLNGHKVTVIVPKKLLPYKEGREKLRKLLMENK